MTFFIADNFGVLITASIRHMISILMLTLIMCGQWSGAAGVVVCHDADESTSIEISCSTGHCCTEHDPEIFDSGAGVIEESEGCVDFNIAQLSLAPAQSPNQDLQLQMSAQPVVLFWFAIDSNVAPTVTHEVIAYASPPPAPPQILIDPIILIA